MCFRYPGLAVLLVLSAVAASASQSDALSPQLADVGHMLPLYEAAMVSRLCSSRALKIDSPASRKACVQAVYPLIENCSRVLHRKFPRADNARRDGRLDHRSFATSYLSCLRRQAWSDGKRARRGAVQSGAVR